MRKVFLILLLCAQGASQSVTPAPGMPWSGILDPTRGIDWRYVGVWNSPPLTGHGIPNRTVPCVITGFNSTNNVVYPSGLRDSTDKNNINGAMQQCAAQATASAQKVLQLSAGTFYIPGGITFNPASGVWGNFITIRGQGPDQTKLVGTTPGGQPQCNEICMVGTTDQPVTSFAPSAYAGACEWTGGYALGSTILTLGNCITGQANPTQNEFTNDPVTGRPVAGMHINYDQANDDVGLYQCHSTGTTATCIVAGPMPARFQVGQCVGIGGMGNNGNMNVKYGTTCQSQGFGANCGTLSGAAQNLVASGYNMSILSPLRYTGSGSQQCTSPITAVGQDTTSGTCTATSPCPTFSFTLPDSGSDAPPWNCGAISNSSSAIQAGWPANTYNLLAGNTYSPCMAIVDTGAIVLTGVICVTASGNCNTSAYGNTSSVAASGGLTAGRTCPDIFYNGSTALRPWIPTCRMRLPADNPPVPNEISLRSQTKVATITAVCTGANIGNTVTGTGVSVPGCQNANQIVIDVPLEHNNWRAEQRPGIYWYHYFLHDAGVEALTIDGFNDAGSTPNGMVAIWHCYNCWLKNVRTISGSRNHIWMYESSQHVEVRDSYLWGNKRGSSQSYATELYFATSDSLMENNIYEHVVTALMNGGSEGNVEAYNYQVDAGYGNINYNIAMQFPNHDTNAALLFEGNNTNGSTLDNIHGTTTFAITVFRERERGQNVPVPNNGLTTWSIWSWNRGNNVIGSIFGVSPGWPPISPPFTGSTPLYHQTYQNLYSGSGACNRSIFCGGSDSQGSIHRNDDYLSIETTMRWGNYDTVTAAASGGDGTGIRWCGIGNEPNCNIGCTVNASPRYAPTCSEVPAAFGTVPGTILPANGIPATHTLPASFYLPSRPAWFVTPWGTPPWPPIGPDVTNGDNSFTHCVNDICGDDGSGHSNMIPAQLAYLNAPIDESYNDCGAGRCVITSASWGLPGTLCGGTASAYGCTTLNGTFYVDAAAAIHIRGATPAGFNGTYQIISMNAPAPGYQNWGWCGSSAYPCIGYPSSVGNIATANSVGYGPWKLAYTRVNTTLGTETIIGSTVNGSSTPSYNTTGQQTTACRSDGSTPAGGTNNCTIRINLPMVKSGSGTAQSDAYNVYIGATSGNFTTILCKQNVPGTPYPGPIPSSTSNTSNDGMLYIQDWPVIPATLDGVTINPACIQPPTVNVPSTQVIYYQATNPCGGTSTVTCNMTAPMGNVVYPYIRVFNADHYYGTGALPPSPPTAMMYVTPSTIQTGGTATLSWTTSGADTVSIGGIGTVSANGSQVVSPASTTTYTLTAINVNGSSGATATLTVTPPGVISPNSIQGIGNIQGQGVIKQP